MTNPVRTALLDRASERVDELCPRAFDDLQRARVESIAEEAAVSGRLPLDDAILLAIDFVDLERAPRVPRVGTDPLGPS